MHLIIVKNVEEVAKMASQMIIDYVSRIPNVVLGLATGSTPLGVYKLICEDYKFKNTNWSQVITFNLDEYISLGSQNPQSYSYFMNKHLFNNININKKNIHFPKNYGDLAKNAQEYEKMIFEKGPIDLQLLGIGENGHIGFNEPGSNLNTITRVVGLSESTKKANQRFFSAEEQIPQYALTMGISTILKAKNIILIASGRRKAEAIKALIHGTISSNWPCSYLQNHKAVTIIIDEEAAALLQNQKKEL